MLVDFLSSLLPFPKASSANILHIISNLHLFEEIAYLWLIIYYFLCHLSTLFFFFLLKKDWMRFYFKCFARLELVPLTYNYYSRVTDICHDLFAIIKHNVLSIISFKPHCPLSLDESWRLIQNQDLRHQTALSLSSLISTVQPSVELCLTPVDHLQPAMGPSRLKPTRSE